MAIEYLTGLNAIVMKAIWNRDKERRKKKFYLFESR